MIDTTFLLAGRATFVVENKQGISITVQVKGRRWKVKLNPYTNRPYPISYFVSTRYQNEPWQYQGLLDVASATIKPTEATQYSSSQHLDLSKRVAEWAIKQIMGRRSAPAGYRLEHTEHCGKCGKMLRDDVSLRRGIGPACARQMGLA